AKVGLMLYEVRRAAVAVGSVLAEDEPVDVPLAAVPTPDEPAGDHSYHQSHEHAFDHTHDVHDAGDRTVEAAAAPAPAAPPPPPLPPATRLPTAHGPGATAAPVRDPPEARPPEVLPTAPQGVWSPYTPAV